LELHIVITARRSEITTMTNQVGSLRTEPKALLAREPDLSVQFERTFAEVRNSRKGLAVELQQQRESTLETSILGLRAAGISMSASGR
jgi:hypothetical protein